MGIFQKSREKITGNLWVGGHFVKIWGWGAFCKYFLFCMFFQVQKNEGSFTLFTPKKHSPTQFAKYGLILQQILKLSLPENMMKYNIMY